MDFKVMLAVVITVFMLLAFAFLILFFNRKRLGFISFANFVEMGMALSVLAVLGVIIALKI